MVNLMIPVFPVPPKNGSFHAKPSDNVTSLLSGDDMRERRCGSYGVVDGYIAGTPPRFNIARENDDWKTTFLLGRPYFQGLC